MLIQADALSRGRLTDRKKAKHCKRHLRSQEWVPLHLWQLTKSADDSFTKSSTSSRLCVKSACGSQHLRYVYEHWHGASLGGALDSKYLLILGVLRPINSRSSGNDQKELPTNRLPSHLCTMAGLA